MIDSYTFDQCKNNDDILHLKIGNLEHAIKEAEEMIAESRMDDTALIFLRRKIAYSKEDLEVLYLLKNQKEFTDN